MKLMRHRLLWSECSGTPLHANTLFAVEQSVLGCASPLVSLKHSGQTALHLQRERI